MVFIDFQFLFVPREFVDRSIAWCIWSLVVNFVAQ